MLIQRGGRGTLPPPGFTTPPWKLLAQKWANVPHPYNPTVVLGSETVTLGHDDPEADDALEEKNLSVHWHTFGWDNESPARTVTLGRFKAEWRPVTNGEFGLFRKENDDILLPRSWCLEGGEVKVCDPSGGGRFLGLNL